MNGDFSEGDEPDCSDSEGVEQIGIVGEGDSVPICSSEQVIGDVADDQLLMVGEEARVFDDPGIFWSKVGRHFDKIITVVVPDKAHILF